VNGNLVVAGQGASSACSLFSGRIAQNSVEGAVRLGLVEGISGALQITNTNTGAQHVIASLLRVSANMLLVPKLDSQQQAQASSALTEGTLEVVIQTNAGQIEFPLAAD